MPWWGGGSESGNSQGEADFTSHEEVSMAQSMPAGAGGGGGMSEMQQMGMALQQQLLVQQVINDLSDRAYEKCITARPADTLSGSQVACIKATVNKWLDTNEFMTGRLQKKSQQSQQGMH
eukprot:CAMPEP_0117042044 /NCGR_PEP_ID=MMETSP0472-20121206/29310_1 /TAXON_ID=693140 ORGANISM="Tiarina fusus, Strain LIS" /NCGR_SAMPLE_ID=MMETSP0472 /ASSEMBLY_ACC=CAM_ASM_000603 /LENGTH=119 /DNA_ID=CAMNT_0004753191 /DNA_START=64 /DNA_END=423 /DNA_ORIENTATION=+